MRLLSSVKCRKGLAMCIAISALLLLCGNVKVFASGGTISNITIDPILDISRFAPYGLQADVTGTPLSVTASLSGINQDGGTYWNFYADGTPFADTVTKVMTDDNADGRWISANIYPDNIYPEIFFAPSSITWNNTPSDAIVRRSNYHLLHFDNPFTMESGSSFFIEINAVPRSLVNSADLEVYLVEKGKNVDFFNADWRNSADLELVGTIGRDTAYHHTHVAGKAAHYLLALTPNADGTIGNKNIDVSDDFWIILYSNSPNNNRGWDLKYHSSNLCTNTESWYIGSQSGWTTSYQTGCPDTHIHMARRGTPSDGVRATVTANYSEGGTVSSTQNILFEPLPNLAPNQTSFSSPQAGAVYDDNQIQITWDAASDPNNDDLTYNLYYYDDTVTTAIAAGITATTFAWDVSAIPDGVYGLKGETCDDAAIPLCTEFFLSANFTLDKADPVYALSGISITSDNADSAYAKEGDVITLVFTASGNISATLAVNIYFGGEVIAGAPVISSLANVWTATYTVTASDSEGPVDYLITADNLDFEYSGSAAIIVDHYSPGAVIASPAAGIYSSAQNVSLSSTGADTIRYTIDGSIPACAVGNIVSGAIVVSSPLTIKAIACDAAGNMTSVYSFPFTFSSGAVFVSATRPSVDNVSVRIENGKLIFQGVSADVAQIAISVFPDFRDASWQDISQGILPNDYIEIEILYIKLRSNDGGVSDAIVYDRRSDLDWGDPMLNDGDIVKVPDNPDVYIIKYRGGKQYKRLILSPSVFVSYHHLKWENIKLIAQENLERYITSTLVQVRGDCFIYELFPDGDIGTRKYLDAAAFYDMDSVYEINGADRDSYRLIK